MDYSIQQASQVLELLPQPKLKVHSAAILVLLRPRFTLVRLVHAPIWLWIAPVWLAFLVFYVRFFTMAYLNAEHSNTMLIGGVLGILIGWPIRSAILHSLSKFVGGRPNFTHILIMSTWATIPLTLRDAVQVTYMLVTQKLLAYPGLSGLLAPSDVYTNDASVLLKKIEQYLLGKLDLFMLWYLVLLVLTVVIGAQITRGKALLVVALYALLFVGSGSLVLAF